MPIESIALLTGLSARLTESDHDSLMSSDHPGAQFMRALQAFAKSAGGKAVEYKLLSATYEHVMSGQFEQHMLTVRVCGGSAYVTDDDIAHLNGDNGASGPHLSPL